MTFARIDIDAQRTGHQLDQAVTGQHDRRGQRVITAGRRTCRAFLPENQIAVNQEIDQGAERARRDDTAEQLSRELTVIRINRP